MGADGHNCGDLDMGLFDRLMQPQAPRRNLMDTQMVRRPSESYLRQDYPVVYGALGGLLGTAPDEMAGSVLDPNTAAVRRGAEYGFPVGTALGVLPAARFTKGLPVGMGIKDVGKKNIDVSLNNSSNFLSAKSEFGQVGGTIRPADKFSDKPYLQINYAEVEKASRGMGKGKELYQSLIDDAQARGLRVFSDSTVEKPAVNVYKSLGKKDYELRDMTKGSLEDGSVYGAGAKNPAFEILPRQSPYPQQAALDLAQQRAALPVSEGGLGLPAGNTAEQRAAAMGFNTDAYHGTNTSNITKFDLGKSNRGEGISVALTPENAQAYGNITYPLKVNQQKIFDPTNKDQFNELKSYVENLIQKQKPYDKDSLSFYPFTSKKVLENLTNPQTGSYYLENELISKSLQDLGYAGSIGMESGKSQLKMFDPDLIRSRFAAFDPFRRSAAIAATMGVAAPDLLANELDYPSNPMYTDPLGYSIR